MSDRLRPEIMDDELDKLVYGKACWLADFSQGGKKRPDHEIDQKRRELTVLKQASADYRAASIRGAA